MNPEEIVHLVGGLDIERRPNLCSLCGKDLDYRDLYFYSPEYLIARVNANAAVPCDQKVYDILVVHES